MRGFAYSRPASLDEALLLLGPSARPLAGGTDLLTLMKADLVVPERLVAIGPLLPRGIAGGAEGLTIGAATTLADVERDPTVSQRFSALAQAAAVAATPQLRNMATLGGNLLQRPRCWYFRNRLARCWLKGGAACHALEGENRLHALFGARDCAAVHPSDLAPALLAFDASARVRGTRGERVVALEDFFSLPTEDRRSETTLRDGELVLEVAMPAHPLETRSVYLKAMDRQAFAFALASVAAVVRLSPRQRIGHARVVLGGVAPIPWRAHGAERMLLGAEVSQRLLQDAADAALEGAVPLKGNAFKIPLAKALVRRALEALVEGKL
jgi:xanthine dehydrogenase YagS FAD-binding subunit